MKKIKIFLSILIALCTLTFYNSHVVYAEGSLTSSGKDSIEIGATDTIVFKLSGVSANSGSIKITTSDGLEITSKKLLITGTTINNIDSSNNGAFAFSSCVNINENLVEVIVKAKNNSVGNQWVKLVVTCNNGSDQTFSGESIKNITVVQSSACAKGNHKWDSGEIRTNPTCTDDGVKIYKCTVCGATKETPITANGHTWNTGVITTEPTCENEGVKTYTCTTCGTTKTESIKALGHICNNGVVTTEAKCLTTGVMTYTCTREGCNETTTEVISALGHSWDKGVVTTEAKCLTTGVMTYTCTREGCNETYTEVIPATGHKWVVKNTVKATCKEEGHIDYECSVCHQTKTEKLSITNEHEFEDVAGTVVEATCLKDGSKQVKCKICGKTEKVIITALGHDWEDAKVTKEATCTEKGEKTVKCKRAGCTATKVTEIPALGHDESKLEITTEATCTEPGIKSGICSRCNKTVTVEIPALGHEFGAETVIQKATCITEGISEKICLRCGYAEQETTGFGEHVLGSDYEVVSEASLTTPGIIKGICLVCGQEAEVESPCEYSDASSGIKFSCANGAFAEGTTLTVSYEDLSNKETNDKYKKLFKDISNKFVVLNFDAILDGKFVEPNGNVDIELTPPEGFSDNIAIVYIDESTLEIKYINTTVENGVIKASLEHFSTYAILDLDIDPADPFWVYATVVSSFVGLVLAIILIIYLVRDGKKKGNSNNNDDDNDDSFLNSDNATETKKSVIFNDFESESIDSINEEKVDESIQEKLDEEEIETTEVIESNENDESEILTVSNDEEETQNTTESKDVDESISESYDEDLDEDSDADVDEENDAEEDSSKEKKKSIFDVIRDLNDDDDEGDEEEDESETESNEESEFISNVNTELEPEKPIKEKKKKKSFFDRFKNHEEENDTEDTIVFNPSEVTNSHSKGILDDLESDLSESESNYTDTGLIRALNSIDEEDSKKS